jgi:hypothetical protein
MRTSHEEFVLAVTAKTKVGATFGQMDVADGLTSGVEHPHTI